MKKTIGFLLILIIAASLNAENNSDIILSLPDKKPNVEIPVIELILK